MSAWLLLLVLVPRALLSPGTSLSSCALLSLGASFLLHALPSSASLSLRTPSRCLSPSLGCLCVTCCTCERQCSVHSNLRGCISGRADDAFRRGKATEMEASDGGLLGAKPGKAYSA